MAATSSAAKTYDLGNAATPYAPLPTGPHSGTTPISPRRSLKIISAILFPSLLLCSLIVLVVNQSSIEPDAPVVLASAENRSANSVHPGIVLPPSRGVSQGVSEKAFRGVSGGRVSYPWTNLMLTWQRTAYHFQPQKNWMNGKITHHFSYYFWRKCIFDISIINH